MLDLFWFVSGAFRSGSLVVHDEMLVGLAVVKFETPTMELYMVYSTRRSGWVFRQKDKTDTQMKKTDMTDIIWKKENSIKLRRSSETTIHTNGSLPRFNYALHKLYLIRFACTECT